MLSKPQISDWRHMWKSAGDVGTYFWGPIFRAFLQKANPDENKASHHNKPVRLHRKLLCALCAANVPPHCEISRSLHPSSPAPPQSYTKADQGPSLSAPLLFLYNKNAHNRVSSTSAGTLLRGCCRSKGGGRHCWTASCQGRVFFIDLPTPPSPPSRSAASSNALTSTLMPLAHARIVRTQSSFSSLCEMPQAPFRSFLLLTFPSAFLLFFLTPPTAYNPLPYS